MSSRELIRVENLALQRGSFRLDVPSWTLGTGQVIGLGQIGQTSDFGHFR